MSMNWNGFNPRHRGGGGRGRFPNRGRARGSWMYPPHHWNSNRTFHNVNNQMESGPPGFHENSRRLRSAPSYDNNNKLYTHKQRTPSPLPGSEEYTQRNIQQTSNLIKRQLNIDSQNELGNINMDLLKETSFDPKPSESNSDNNEETNKTVSVHQSQKKIKSNKTKRNSETIDVAEIHDKIIKHISKLSYNKKMNLVNQGSAGYDTAIHQLQKQQRLELSRALRDMSNRATQDEDCLVINSIIPDIGIKIEDLPRAVIAKLSSTLDIDLDSNLVDPEECFKQAQQLLSFDDFVNFQENETTNYHMEQNDNTSQYSAEPMCQDTNLKKSIYETSEFDPYGYNPFSNSHHSNEETPIIEPDHLYTCNEASGIEKLTQETDIFSQLNLNTTHSYLSQMGSNTEQNNSNDKPTTPVPEIKLKVRTDLCSNETSMFSNQKIKLNRNRIKKEEPSEKMQKLDCRIDRKKHKKQKKLKVERTDSTYDENVLYKEKVKSWIEQLPDDINKNDANEIGCNEIRDRSKSKEKKINNLEPNLSELHDGVEYNTTRERSISKERINTIELNQNDVNGHNITEYNANRDRCKEKSITLNLLNANLKLKTSECEFRRSGSSEMKDVVTTDHETVKPKVGFANKSHKNIDKFHRYERDYSSDQSDNINELSIGNFSKETNEVSGEVRQEHSKTASNRSKRRSRERRDHKDKNKRSSSSHRSDADSFHRYKNKNLKNDSFRNRSTERIESNHSKANNYNAKHDKDKSKESGDIFERHEKPKYNRRQKETRSHHRHSRKISNTEEPEKKNTDKFENIKAKNLCPKNQTISKDLNNLQENEKGDNEVKNNKICSTIEKVSINTQLTKTEINDVNTNSVNHHQNNNLPYSDVLKEFKVPKIGSSPQKSAKVPYYDYDEDLDYELSSNSSCIDLQTNSTTNLSEAIETDVNDQIISDSLQNNNLINITPIQDKPEHSIVLELMEEFNKSMEIEKTVRKSRSLERTSPKKNEHRRFKSEDRLDAETYSNKFDTISSNELKIDELFESNIPIVSEDNVVTKLDKFDNIHITKVNDNMDIKLTVDEFENITPIIDSENENLEIKLNIEEIENVIPIVSVGNENMETEFTIDESENVAPIATKEIKKIDPKLTIELEPKLTIEFEPIENIETKMDIEELEMVEPILTVSIENKQDNLTNEGLQNVVLVPMANDDTKLNIASIAIENTETKLNIQKLDIIPVTTIEKTENLIGGLQDIIPLAPIANNMDCKLPIELNNETTASGNIENELSVESIETTDLLNNDILANSIVSNNILNVSSEINCKIPNDTEENCLDNMNITFTSSMLSNTSTLDINIFGQSCEASYEEIPSNFNTSITEETENFNTNTIQISNIESLENDTDTYIKKRVHKLQKSKLHNKKQLNLIPTDSSFELPLLNNIETVNIPIGQNGAIEESFEYVTIPTEKRKRKSKSGVKNSARPKSKQKKLPLTLPIYTVSEESKPEHQMMNYNNIEPHEKHIFQVRQRGRPPGRKRKCPENLEPIAPFKIIRSDIRERQTVETQTEAINISKDYNVSNLNKEEAITSLKEIDLQIDYLIKQRQNIFNQLCNVITVKTETMSTSPLIDNSPEHFRAELKCENVIEEPIINNVQEYRPNFSKKRRRKTERIVNIELNNENNNVLNENKLENTQRVCKRVTRLPNKTKQNDYDETIEAVVSKFKDETNELVSVDNIEKSNSSCVEDKSSTKNKELSIKLIRYDMNSLLKLKDNCKINSNPEVKQECVPVLGEGVDVQEDTKLFNISPAQVDFENWTGSILYIKVIDETVLASNDRGTFYFFNLYTGKLIHSIVLSQKPITSFCIVKQHGEIFLYVGCLAGILHVINYSTYEIVKTINVEDPIQCMESSWGYIFMGSHKGNLIRYDIKNDILGEGYEISKSNVLVLRACQEGARRVLLVATRSSPVSIRDAMTGLIMRTMEGTLNPTVYTILFHNNHVYCGTSQHDVLVYTFQDGQLMFKHEQSNTSGVVCMTIINNLLFVGCYNGNIYVYNTKTNEFITSMVGPGGLFLSMEVSGNMIIAGTKQNHFRAWKMPSSIMEQMS